MGACVRGWRVGGIGGEQRAVQTRLGQGGKRKLGRARQMDMDGRLATDVAPALRDLQLGHVLQQDFCRVEVRVAIVRGHACAHTCTPNTCMHMHEVWVPVFLRMRRAATNQHPLGVLAKGQGHRWRPVADSASPCSTPLVVST